MEAFSPEALRHVLSVNGAPLLESQLEAEAMRVVSLGIETIPSGLSDAMHCGRLVSTQTQVLMGLMLDMSAAYLKEENDPARALHAADLCAQMARLVGDFEALARSLARQATCLHELGRDEDRLEPAIEEAWAWDLAGDSRKRLNSLLSAFSFALQQEDTRASSLHGEALELARELGDDKAQEQLKYLEQYVVTETEVVGLTNGVGNEAAWRVLMEERDERRAFDMFAQAARQNPADYDAREGLGICYGMMATDAEEAGRYTEAIDLNTKALAELAASGQGGQWTQRQADFTSMSLNARGVAHFKLACDSQDTDANLAAAANDYQQAVQAAADPEIRAQAQRNIDTIARMTKQLGMHDPTGKSGAGKAGGCLTLCMPVVALSVVALLAAL